MNKSDIDAVFEAIEILGPHLFDLQVEIARIIDANRKKMKESPDLTAMLILQNEAAIQDLNALCLFKHKLLLDKGLIQDTRSDKWLLAVTQRIQEQFSSMDKVYHAFATEGCRELFVQLYNTFQDAMPKNILTFMSHFDAIVENPFERLITLSK